jgi:hypothetical protein
MIITPQNIFVSLNISQLPLVCGVEILRTFFFLFRALFIVHLGVSQTEKSLQDTFFSVFDVFFCRIEIVKLVKLYGSLIHEYNYTRVIYRRADFTTFYPYELRTFCENILVL